jgi:hypothetical protein
MRQIIIGPAWKIFLFCIAPVREKILFVPRSTQNTQMQSQHQVGFLNVKTGGT